MKGENINISVPNRILIAPLDWGLGHATRCIPIIKELSRQGAEVIIAAGKKTTPLLKAEFPDHTFLPIADYDISYSHKGSLFLKLMSQAPGIIKKIKNENQWLKEVIKQYHIKAVISDNRFGLYNNSVYAVYITHQLKFKTSISVINSLMQSVHYRFINRYDECWVPDDKNSQLAGEMAQPGELKVPLKYTGPLSRLTETKGDKKYAFLFLLSGPEPQRTILEKTLLREFADYDKPFVVVRGLPAEKQTLEYKNQNALIFDHLNTEHLSKMICQSEVIISRSGYSTVMDLSKTGSKAVFVPTPGQAEQEYLAKYLGSKNYCTTILQKNLEMGKILKACKNSFGFPPATNPGYILENVIAEFLNRLREGQ